MKQLDFERKYQAFWEQCEALLQQLENPSSRNELYQKHWPQFPHYYRKLCQQLSTAQSRQYSPLITDYLHNIVLRGHRYLYQQKSSPLHGLKHFIASGFPVALRKEWRSWLLASCTFYIPAIFMGLMCYFDSEFILSLIEYDQLKSVESMYDPSNAKIGREEGRQSDSDFMMFGFYIWNNVGIDFKAYASGLLFGIGTLFFMIFNGLYIGAVAGHLSGVGFVETFWSFVSGHSALELTAATIAGAAGLKLGYALINPKGFTRILALKHAGIESFPLISGAALMTFLAAFVEGFWSATPGVAAEIKYAVGIIAWVAVFSYLLLAGKNNEA